MLPTDKIDSISLRDLGMNIGFAIFRAHGIAIILEDEPGTIVITDSKLPN